MKQKNDIFLNEIATAMHEVEAPNVDITAQVMSHLPDFEPLPSPRSRVMRRVVLSAAACLLAIIAIDLTTLYAHDYDEASLGRMFTQTHDTENYFDDSDYESTFMQEYASLQ